MTLTAVQARQLAGIFSRPVFRALGANSLPSAARLQLRNAAAALGFSGDRLSALFELAFREILKTYRSEYVYKNIITRKLIFGVHSPTSAALLGEFWVNASKADSVILNGTSTVYEIKTEFDNLSRLPQQLVDYGKVFDHINVVTHAGAVSGVLDVAPPHVGVLTLTSRNTLKRVRGSLSNVENIDHWAMFNCIHKQELKNILERQFGHVPETSPDMFRTRAFAEFKTLPKTVASAEFVRELRNRTTGLELANFARQLPESLKTLGLVENLSSRRREKVLSSLRDTGCDVLLRA
ncbi:sce7726 family protein [Paraburkholderia caribensis]|uniref:sce7726 family protein n=1 Tax=Paraburkholderia caribensis TaxID=75105 RepID=UPI0012E98EB7|nr:sce7726 family protein [Paraburkholderia caribensis]